MKKLVLIFALSVVAGNAAAGDAAAGREKSKPCVACHGDTGVSAAADFPNLAGQHYGYLVRVLHDYKTGARKNPIMAAQVANLKRNDIADLSAFYASQQALFTKK